MSLPAAARPASSWLLAPNFADRARDVAYGQRLVVEDVPLDDPRAAAPANGLQAQSTEAAPTGTLNLRRIEVFRSGQPIVLHRGGREVKIAAPNTVYFAGTIEGRSGSFAFLSIDEDDSTRGLVSDGAGLWQVGSEAGTPNVTLLDPNATTGESTAPWGCGNEEALVPPETSPAAAAAAAADVLAAAAADAGSIYVADVALETDAEFHDLFDTTDEAVAYVGDLFAAVSAIYERDVGTVVRLSHLSLWADGPAADPWDSTSTMGGLNEFMAEWRANQGGVSRTVAHFLSGKRTGGGVAYVGVLCSGYYGYGFTGSINGRFSTTEPWLFWDIMGTSHELGHNFGSGHTHCYSPPIDHCYGSQSNCYAGATSVPSNGGGTIMSYCHLRSGGYGNINLWFGRQDQYGDDSLRVPDLMRTRVESAWCMETLAGPPTVDLSASPTSIAAGEPSVLTWSTTDADACSFVGGITEAVAANGALEVRPGAPNTYEIECTGLGGTTTATVAVHVDRPQTMVDVVASTLRITGPPTEPARLTIRAVTSVDGDYVEIVDRKSEIVPPEGGPCAAVRSKLRCTGTFSLIEVFLGDRRDRVVVRGSIPAFIDGGGDDDILRGGDGDDTLIGGDGRDRLFGRDGNDSLQGDDGADRLDGGRDDDFLDGGLGPDVINGRRGDDTAVYLGRPSEVTVTFDDVPNDGEAGEGDNVRSSVEHTI